MKNRHIITFLAGLLFNFLPVLSQDLETGNVYTMPILANPALTGVHGDGLLILSYRDFYPGNRFGLGSVYLSYDSFFESLHGGIGGYISENRLGDILNDLRSGVTWSYHLRATRKLYINAGFMASVINRSINMNNIVFPDQIDPFLGPVLPSGESRGYESRTVFDAGVGFLASWEFLHAGVSVNHLAKPDLSGSGRSEGRLGRRYTLHAGGNFEIARTDLVISPLIIANYQSNFTTISAGSVFNYKILSVNSLVNVALESGATSVQAGIHLDAGRLSLAYSYLFNAVPGSATIPGTLSNQITLYFRLNNVDKTGVINAINCPKL